MLIVNNKVWKVWPFYPGQRYLRMLYATRPLGHSALQPVAKVLETVAQRASPTNGSWSCARDPPPPLFKVASNTRQCSKLGGTTLNGGEEEGGLLFYLTDLWLAAIWSKTGCFLVSVSQHFCNWLWLVSLVAVFDRKQAMIGQHVKGLFGAK